MKYAMTGATGFVGRALLRQLRADGHEVVALVRSPDRAGDLADAGVEIVAGDVSDIPAMVRAFSGTDGVFHVAGWYKVGNPDWREAWSVNVDGTRNALEAARQAEVPRVVYTSTCAINSDTDGATVDETYRHRGPHLTTYDETKSLAHDVAAEFAVARDRPEVVIVMPGGIYGPGDSSQVGQLLEQVATGHRALVSARLRMVEAHVDDIAAGHVLAMTRGRAGEAYMLAGERTDLASMAEEMARITDGPRPIVMPGPLLPVAERVLAVAGRVLPLPSDFSAEAMRSARSSYLGTSAKARRELGWTYRSLYQGLRDTARSEGWV
ncbi:MAG: NAD-dependent epimerase/dehydratase family protein [Candidatus Nanopelagicales bacterium]